MWFVATVVAIFAVMVGMAAPSGQPKNFGSGVVRASDGTGTPVTLSVPWTDGDVAIAGIMQHLNVEQIITARTSVIGLTRGKPSIPTISFSAFVGNLVGSSTSAPGTFLEFATGKGAYSANISTLGASREITIDLRLTIEGTAWGDSADETIDLEDCVLTFDFAESETGNKLTCSGKCLGAVIVTNSANTVTYTTV